VNTVPGSYSQHSIFFVTLIWAEYAKCYITLKWKVLLGTSTLAYWVHSYVMNKMKYCEYLLRDLLCKTLFSSQLMIEPNKLKCYITLGWKGLTATNTLAYRAHFLSCDEHEVLWIRLQNNKLGQLMLTNIFQPSLINQVRLRLSI
jgi:hypothetical protein